MAGLPLGFNDQPPVGLAPAELRNAGRALAATVRVDPNRPESARGLRQSMSRTGWCLDNAVAGSWFASLKVELVGRHHYRTRAEARTAIFAWIAWYNRFRLHSTRGDLPPIEWEHQHAIMSQLPSTTAA